MDVRRNLKNGTTKAITYWALCICAVELGIYAHVHVKTELCET